MVGAELHLETVLSPGIWGRHHAGIVDQQVQPLVMHLELGGKTTDRGLAGQVQGAHVQDCPRRSVEDILARLVAFRQGAAGQDDLGARAVS